MEAHYVDLDGVYLHTVPPIAHDIARDGYAIVWHGYQDAWVARKLDRFERYLSGHILPSGKPGLGIKSYIRSDYYDNYCTITPAGRDRPALRLELQDNIIILKPYFPRHRNVLFNLWRDERHNERFRDKLTNLSHYRNLGLLPPVPGYPGRALVWKAVKRVCDTSLFKGLLLAPYEVSQEFSYPGAMACAGPFGAASQHYWVRHILAIAADIRAPSDPLQAADGAVYAERGIPIASYRVSSVDAFSGNIDLIPLERSVPYDPLDLL